jgi:Tfp pilus assembly protein PilV
MKSTTFEPLILKPERRLGFSLIEVVMAIGIFLITVLALVGLLGPTLQSVDEVEKTDEIASVVNTVNAFLQSSDAINPGGSNFDAIYSAVKSNNYATLFVFRAFADDDDPNDIVLKVGFDSSEGMPADATVTSTDFEDAAGPIYRVVLTASSVVPDITTTNAAGDSVPKYRSAERTSDTLIYTLEADLEDYEEGYFPMEVRIFPESLAAGGTFNSTTNLSTLAGLDPAFTYNTAVVR